MQSYFLHHPDGYMIGLAYIAWSPWRLCGGGCSLPHDRRPRAMLVRLPPPVTFYHILRRHVSVDFGDEVIAFYHHKRLTLHPRDWCYRVAVCCFICQIIG